MISPNTAALWLPLYAAQFIGVILITLAIGGSLPLGPPQVGSIGMIWQFVPALLPIPFALLAYQWVPARSPGKWIWIPWFLFSIRAGFEKGVANSLERFGAQFSGVSPVAALVSGLMLSCSFYSLTMFILGVFEKRKRRI